MVFTTTETRRLSLKDAQYNSPSQKPVRQINSTTFYVYNPKPVQLHIKCTFGHKETKLIKRATIVTLAKVCKGSLQKTIFSVSLEIDEEAAKKMTGANINIKRAFNARQGRHLSI